MEQKDNIKFKDAFCLFVDILGFRKECEASIKGNADDDFLKRMESSINKAKEIYESFVSRYEPYISSKNVKYNIFSDNMAFGFFEDYSGDKMVISICVLAAALQIEFIKNNFFLRGGIDFGRLYMEEDMIVGSSLISAFDLENITAINPRIILSELVQKKFEQSKSVTDGSIFKELLLIDSDGYCFINYLTLFMKNKDEHELFLTEHKNITIEKLKKYKKEIDIREKYLWIANYHNYYCINNHCDEFIIEEEYTEKQIKKLSE